MMTNEEAIKALKRIRDEAINNFVGDWQDYEAFDIALNALADHKDELQTMYYPQVDGIVSSVIVPQTDTDLILEWSCSFSECDNFDHFGLNERCVKCKHMQRNADEPHTDYTPDCPFCKRYGTEDCLGLDCRHYKTYKGEPQTKCDNCKIYWNCQGQCDEMPQIEDKPQVFTLGKEVHEFCKRNCDESKARMRDGDRFIVCGQANDEICISLGRCPLDKWVAGEGFHILPMDEPQTDEEQFCIEHKCTYYQPKEGGCTKNNGDCPFNESQTNTTLRMMTI